MKQRHSALAASGAALVLRCDAGAQFRRLLPDDTKPSTSITRAGDSFVAPPAHTRGGKHRVELSLEFMTCSLLSERYNKNNEPHFVQ